MIILLRIVLTITFWAMLWFVFGPKCFMLISIIIVGGLLKGLGEE